MKTKIKARRPKRSVTRRARPSRAQAKGKNRAEFKSIIVPIDFSETSIKALEYAGALAGKFGSKLRLIHILEFPAVFNSSSRPAYAAWDRGVETSAKTRLTDLLDEKVDELIPATAEVHFGRAYKTICELALDRKADLIVIGTHGFTGLKHLLLGSTAERVIRHAPCSVLAIRTKEVSNEKTAFVPKNILVPTDFSLPGEEALRLAVALAREHGARLQLLYVVPIHYAVGDYDVMDYAVLAAEQKEEGQKQLDKLSKKLKARGISVKTQIRHGRPAVEINEAAAEIEADLIVISTRGNTGWQHALMGSTAEEVVRHSVAPVLIVRKK